MRILLLASLLALPMTLQASVDCNDRANEIRLSDRLNEAIDVLGRFYSVETY